MAPTDVEITISRAHDLKNVNWKHGDLCAYAVAWIEDGKQPIKVTTRVDPSGDTSPSWGQRFTLSVSKERLEDARLIVEIYHDTKTEDTEKAIVGRASLALLEVMDAGGYDESQEYTLKLKRPSGRPHGKIDVVIRLRERRGAYSEPPPPAAGYGQGYYNSHEGGQANREWQSSYPGYSPPYPAQPYGQNYPTQPYPGSYPYGGTPSSYGTPPPQPYGSYGAPPPSNYQEPYGAPPSNYYGQPPPSNYQEPAPQNSSKFGGIGTGLAVGALAGAVGGLALGEYVDHKEDEAADEQAEEDADRYAELDAARDDDYGGGDDYGDDY
eukprot:c2445_g1_i1 orf=58-1029(+)